MAKEIKEKVEPVPAAVVGETLKKVVPTFTKTQLATSRKYIHRRDALNALLDDSKQYTFAQVDKILIDFDKGVK